MPKRLIATDHGFSTDTAPQITTTQVFWLLERMQVEDDLSACRVQKLDPLKLKEWLENPGFRQVYDQCLDNSREGIKYLSTQVLPKVMQVLLTTLDIGSANAQMRAADMILRMNALLIDRQERTAPDTVEALLERLRAPRIPGPPNLLAISRGENADQTAD